MSESQKYHESILKKQSHIQLCNFEKPRLLSVSERVRSACAGVWCAGSGRSMPSVPEQRSGACDVVTTLYRPQSMPGTRAITTLSKLKFKNTQNIDKKEQSIGKSLG